jgi:hypothetical protein
MRRRAVAPIGATANRFKYENGLLNNRETIGEELAKWQLLFHLLKKSGKIITFLLFFYMLVS